MPDTLKKAVFWAARSETASRFVGWLERAGDSRPHLLRVLTYHRVDDPYTSPHLYPGLISASPGDFEIQMALLARQYTVVSVQDVLNAYEGNKILPPRAVLITFDDATLDFERNAWPVLKALNIPAVMFVATAFPDDPLRSYWWDRVHRALQNADPSQPLKSAMGEFPMRTPVQRREAARRLNEHIKSLPHQDAMTFVDNLSGAAVPSGKVSTVMDWGRLKSLVEEGLCLGAHTRTHPMMDRVSREELRVEIEGSLSDIRQNTGQALPIFAYPGGQFNSQAVDTVREAGVKLAFTTVRGINDLRTANPLLLKRINIGRQTPLTLLRAQMAPLAKVAT